MDKEDRLLNLIEKMYSEFSDRFDETEEKFQEIENILQKNSETIARMENKMDNKFGALFDGHGLHSDRLDRIEDGINNIEKTIATHDLEIKKADSVKEDDMTDNYGKK